MSAQTIASFDAHEMRMKRGRTYRATTKTGTACGEYLGMEAPHGDLAILLRGADGVHSIELDHVTGIERLAA